MSPSLRGRPLRAALDLALSFAALTASASAASQYAHTRGYGAASFLEDPDRMTLIGRVSRCGDGGASD